MIKLLIQFGIGFVIGFPIGYLAIRIWWKWKIDRLTKDMLNIRFKS